ncbi:MAG: ATP-binding protein [Myxococcota bacterium]|nr:ATP-binding protein [Myxococcota bacterium]MDW8364016.1 ATP-binding protein [Myxococcales bacterium]
MNDLPTICERHALTLAWEYGSLTPEAMGLHGLPYADRMRIEGLRLGRCAQCDPDSPVRLGGATRRHCARWFESMSRLFERYPLPEPAEFVVDARSHAQSSATDGGPIPAEDAQSDRHRQRANEGDPAPRRSPSAGGGSVTGSRARVPAEGAGGSGLLHELDPVPLEALVLPEQVRRLLEVARTALCDDAGLATWGFADLCRPVILLAGPPGTGKTMAARALAGAARRPLLRVDLGLLESKYVGETPKNIAAAFREAAARGALLFFDEADVVLGRRIQHVASAADQGVNAARAAMLSALDERTVPVVFATNEPRVTDRAFERRITLGVEFPLPDVAGRRDIVAREMRRAPLGPDPDALLALVAERSEGLSGGDLRELVRLAVMFARCDQPPSERLEARHLEEALARVHDKRRLVVRERIVSVTDAPLPSTDGASHVG